MSAVSRFFAFVFACMAAFSVHAQTSYPSKPVTIICAYAAGGGGDIIVRRYAAELQKLAKQPFIVENRVGANGHIGNRFVMDSKPDGYTIIVTGDSSIVGNPLIMNEANYDPLSALTPIGTFSDIGLILVVSAKSDIKTVADLSAQIKAKQGGAKYAAATVSQRMMSPWYLQSIGAQGVEVGYKATTDAVGDVAAGLVDFIFADATLAMSQAAAGRVRMLATTTKQRLSFAKDLPTMEETGLKGLVYSVMWGAWAPARTPPEIVNQLHDWMNQITAMEDVRTFLNQAGADPLAVASPAVMAGMLKEKYSLWQRLVALAKLEKQ